MHSLQVGDATHNTTKEETVIGTNSDHWYDYCLAEILEAYAHEASNRGVVARGKQCCKKTGAAGPLSVYPRKVPENKGKCVRGVS